MSDTWIEKAKAAKVKKDEALENSHNRQIEERRLKGVAEWDALAVHLTGALKRAFDLDVLIPAPEDPFKGYSSQHGVAKPFLDLDGYRLQYVSHNALLTPASVKIMVGKLIPFTELHDEYGKVYWLSGGAGVVETAAELGKALETLDVELADLVARNTKPAAPAVIIGFEDRRVIDVCQVLIAILKRGDQAHGVYKAVYTFTLAADQRTTGGNASGLVAAAINAVAQVEDVAAFNRTSDRD